MLVWILERLLAWLFCDWALCILFSSSESSTSSSCSYSSITSHPPSLLPASLMTFAYSGLGWWHSLWLYCLPLNLFSWEVLGQTRQNWIAVLELAVVFHICKRTQNGLWYHSFHIFSPLLPTGLLTFPAAPKTLWQVHRFGCIVNLLLMCVSFLAVFISWFANVVASNFLAVVGFVPVPFPDKLHSKGIRR